MDEKGRCVCLANPSRLFRTSHPSHTMLDTGVWGWLPSDVVLHIVKHLFDPVSLGDAMHSFSLVCKSGRDAVAEGGKEQLQTARRLRNVMLWANKPILQLVSGGTFTLSNIRLPRRIVQSIAQTVLHPMSRITTLNITSSGIDEAKAVVIAEALKINKVLTSLSLDFNEISNKGAAAIAEALKINKVLTRLSLDDNEISNVGAVAIAEALKINKVMTKLYLCSSQIGDAEAAAIDEALQVNEVLKILKLKGNNAEYNSE